MHAILKIIARLASWHSLVLLLLLLFAGCSSAQRREATQTAAGSAQSTYTRTPSGEYLNIDGKRVIKIFVPTSDGPPRYALTDERFWVWATGVWKATETKRDERSILIDAVDPLRLYRGKHPICDRDPATSYTFSKSLDGGQTWRAIPAGENIEPLATDPALPNVIYGGNCGLAISSDGGETWRAYYRSLDYIVVDVVIVGERVLLQERAMDGHTRIVEIRVVNPEKPQLEAVLLEADGIYGIDADADRIVVATTAGVQISLDGGRTWTTTRIGLEGVTVESEDSAPPPDESGYPAPARGVLTVKLDPANASRIFAGTVHGLYVSQDNGVTWDRYSPAPIEESVQQIQIGDAGSDLFLTTPSGVLVVPNL